MAAIKWETFHLQCIRGLSVMSPKACLCSGTHHSKAFIIEHETGLRVVIHTANLIYCDNNYKSQGLWVQDFPKKVKSLNDCLVGFLEFQY